jgi:AraC-like DNA-binding protein
MAERFRISRLLPQKLGDLAVAPAAVLRVAGLPPGFFEQEKLQVDTAELFALYQAIAEISQDPAIGLRIGAEERVERFDPVSIAALHARTFRDAVERAGRYKQLTCPEAISILPRGRECVVRFEWTRAREPEPPVLTDQCYAWLLAIGRRGTGLPLAPLRVEYRRPPASAEVYQRHFGCPVRFGAAQNALVFHAEDLDRPLQTYNPELAAIITPQLEQELASRAAARGPREQVKQTLQRLLAGRRPELKDVARELAQSTRTLQRRLAGAGATYQEVLDEARSEQARHYLQHSDLELGEVAFLLGYEDTNSFFRAFHRWEGVPPGRWHSGLRDLEAVAE